jgi:exodeoxyribonuclease VII small subunit
MEQENNMNTKIDISKLKYEEALQQLEQVINHLESGVLELDEMLARFEQGKDLLAHCQQLLDQAELRVREIGQLEEKSSDQEDQP